MNFSQSARFFHSSEIVKTVTLKLTQKSTQQLQLPLFPDSLNSFPSRFLTADSRTVEESSIVLVPERKKTTFVPLRKSHVSRLFETKQNWPALTVTC
jgi:hypothetical protein